MSVRRGDNPNSRKPFPDKGHIPTGQAPVVLDNMIKGAVKLDVRDPHVLIPRQQSQRPGLRLNQCLQFRLGNRLLPATEILPVFEARMCTGIHAEFAA